VRVAGGGFARLRRAGLEVVVGVLEEECRTQHRGFISVCERGRPFVTLKLAATLDGRIATAAGESRWITGPASRARVHRLRRRVDAVLVGSGTAIADDPDLTARVGERVVRTPVRVVIDGSLRVPASSRLFARSVEGTTRTWIVCATRARGIAAARRRADRVLEIDRDRSGQVDLPRAFAAIAAAGLTSVLVEGGGRLAAALLRADLVDEVHWFLAPRLIGEEGRPALGKLALGALRDAVALDALRIDRCGDDLHLSGRVARRTNTRAAGQDRPGQKLRKGRK
jgi:diaminohydroxyphosphoribosylaminopyrimidine deaminase / 5-amino-6-(5-phosphoribosylamino)uracil reductase